MPEELLRVVEAAELLKVSRGTIIRWIRLGQLPAIRLPSGTYRVPKSAIDKLLAQLQQDDGQP
jgi:excisionase family DNA binding protein